MPPSAVTDRTPRPRAPLTDEKAFVLAETIEGSRRQFGDAFKAGQANRTMVLEFEVVARGAADYTQAFSRAFKRADADGWLEDLCVACLTAEIVSDDFLRKVGRVIGKGRPSQLQQIVDTARGIPDAGLLATRLPRAMAQVCRIEIDTHAAGTGFLIRADLVMTAYHVIKPLLDVADAQLPGSHARLAVRFDLQKQESRGVVALNAGVLCRVAKQWLVKFSPCTKEELLNLLPGDPDLLNGFWDFAVIQLAEVAGVSRNGLDIASVPVRKGRRLTIIQHPTGLPLGIDTATIRGFLGTSDRFRIVHEVNTDGGFSGSPCLNDDFKVVGVHQAEMPPAARVARNGIAVKSNRAVPMSNILSFWQLQAAPALAASVARVLTVATPNEAEHPVFGRARLQDWVARSAQDAGVGAVSDRFLAVGGPQGCGKSFSTFIIKTMLPPGQHLVAECRASEFSAESSAVEFAKKFLLGPLGASADQMPSLAQADTSDNAWLSRQFVPDLLTALDTSRKKRMVWFVLDELDDVGLPDQGQVRKLLDIMYARAPQFPWIRFVLLGLDDVPVPGLGAATEREAPTPASDAALATDVADYLIRQMDTKGLNHDDPFVRAAATGLVAGWLPAHKDLLTHPKLLEDAARAIVSFEQHIGVRPPRR